MREAPSGLADVFDEEGYRPILDGSTLAGWTAISWVYGAVRPGGPQLSELFAERGVTPPPEPERHPAVSWVEDGVLVGAHATPGFGGYLLSDDDFGSFHLALEICPDWPADTGVTLRRSADDWAGFQVLVDHRRDRMVRRQRPRVVLGGALRRRGRARHPREDRPPRPRRRRR